jgi:copper(I)-binding protein
MRRRHFLLVPALIAASPASFAQSVAHGGILVQHAWARAAAEEGMTSVVYLTIVNRGGDDTLTHAHTPVATASVLHQTRNDGGVMRMLSVANIPLPSGQRVALKPGGYHIMLVGLVKPLKPGDKFPLSLTFGHAGTLIVQVHVLKPGATGITPDDEKSTDGDENGGDHNGMSHGDMGDMGGMDMK